MKWIFRPACRLKIMKRKFAGLSSSLICRSDLKLWRGHQTRVIALNVSLGYLMIVLYNLSWRTKVMNRIVLAIPIEELQQHFKKNEQRKDVKIVAPSILTDELYDILTGKGKHLKREIPCVDISWKHSKADQPNELCESGNFADYSLPQYAKGPFAISFANEGASQDRHYHKQHLEIYYSEHRISAEYKLVGDSAYETIELKSGGVIVFSTHVIHKIKISGLTIVIEMPAIDNDREVE
jgi:hypothetical protein